MCEDREFNVSLGVQRKGFIAKRDTKKLRVRATK